MGVFSGLIDSMEIFAGSQLRPQTTTRRALLARAQQVRDNVPVRKAAEMKTATAEAVLRRAPKVGGDEVDQVRRVEIPVENSRCYRRRAAVK